MSARRNRRTSRSQQRESAVRGSAKRKARSPLLTGEWRQLAMVNYQVDPAVVKPLVPRGTEIDFFQGHSYLSVVGFMFFDVRLRGLAFPWHRDFPEVNLRFYVRRKVGQQWRRGVVFVQEIVPRWGVSFIARRLYHEHFVSRRMRHELQLADGSLGEGGEATYAWRLAGRWHEVYVRSYGLAELAQPRSLDEFITEHYWGYTRCRDGRTLEYEVTHPQWRLWKAADAQLDCDVASVYGSQFVSALSAPPTSALLAEGSEIAVYHGQRIG